MSQKEVLCDKSYPKEDDDVRCTLDGLLLQMIHLIEELQLQHTQVNKETARAQLVLARIRLRTDAQRIPAEAQLPRGRPYKALIRVAEEQSSWGKVFRIVRLPVNPILGYLRPVTNIFGSMLPDDLRFTNLHWEHCLDLILKCANIKRELQSTIVSIEKLRYFLSRRQ